MGQLPARPATMSDETGSLLLVAGAPKPSPPMSIALLIVALGVIGPLLEVRTAAPNPFLTAMVFLISLAGIVAFAGALDGRRRWHMDRAVRVRAEIGRTGIVLRPQPDRQEHIRWADIALARASQNALVLHLEDGGRRWRRVVRYGVLVTPLAAIEARIDGGLRGRLGWDC